MDTHSKKFTFVCLHIWIVLIKGEDKWSHKGQIIHIYSMRPVTWWVQERQQKEGTNIACRLIGHRLYWSLLINSVHLGVHLSVGVFKWRLCGFVKKALSNSKCCRTRQQRQELPSFFVSCVLGLHVSKKGNWDPHHLLGYSAVCEEIRLLSSFFPATGSVRTEHAKIRKQIFA